MVMSKSPKLIKFLRITLIAILPATYFLKQRMTYESIFANFTFWVFCLAYFFCLTQMMISFKIFRFNSIDILLFVFAFYVFLCTLWSPHFDAGIKKAIEFMFITLPIVYLVRFFLRESIEIEQVIKTSIFIALLLVIPFMVDFVSSGETINRVTPKMVEPVAMGLFCSIHAYSSIYFFFKGKGKFFYMFSSILFLVSLFLTGSRASIAGLILVMFWFFLRKIRGKIRKRYLVRNILAIFMIGFMLIVVNKFIPIGKYIMDRFSIAFSSSDPASQIRIILWKRSLDSISENPLFGKGTGSESWGYAHNIFLEITSENGLFGTFLLLVIIFQFFRIKNKIKNERIYELIMGIFMICILVSLFSFSYSFHRYLFFSLGLILTLYHFWRINDASTKSINNNTIV